MKAASEENEGARKDQIKRFFYELVMQVVVFYEETGEKGKMKKRRSKKLNVQKSGLAAKKRKKKSRHSCNVQLSAGGI